MKRIARASPEERDDEFNLCHMDGPIKEFEAIFIIFPLPLIIYIIVT
jgi:hypothetical protein